MLQLTFYLDTRRPKQDNRFPLRLQVYQGRKDRIYYKTGENFTLDEWKLISNKKARERTLNDAQVRVYDFYDRAFKIYRDNSEIGLKEFDSLFTGNTKPGKLVKDLYEERIAEFKRRDQYGTATIYQSALNNIDSKRPGLTFEAITKDLLMDLEHEMTIATSTKGIYLRTLRTIYNVAIERKIVKKDLYPFGSKRYAIPTSTSHKRALTKQEKNTLVNYEPEIREWRDALRVWKFSYYANGMNCADMALLKPEHIKSDVIVYTRKKTVKTERKGSKLTIPISRSLKKILKEGFFNVLDGTETAEKERKKVQQWTHTTNKYLKRIGKKLKLPLNLTTYTARHTFATMLQEQGVDIYSIMEALGHASVETTVGYLASLSLDKKRKMSAKL